MIANVKNIEVRRVWVVLEDLLGRDVEVASSNLTPHPATMRGLVDNQDQLKGVIGSDLPFAHFAGAALALIPAGAAAEAGDQPSPDLIEIYHEVANVLSQLVNEISTTRMRIDPGLDHSQPNLASVVESSPFVAFKVAIKGYGEGHVGFWLND